MAKSLPKHDDVVEALMRLAVSRKWSEIELADLAAEAGMSLASLRDLFPSKGAILGSFSRMIDKKVLQKVEVQPNELEDESARERLFDILMQRLDAMTPYKEALKRIYEEIKSEPVTLLSLNQVAINSHRYMMAAANLSTEGRFGFVKVQGIVLSFSRVMQVWFRDDDPDLSRTMACLDRELGKGEKILRQAGDVCKLAAPLTSFFKRSPLKPQGAKGL